MCDSWGAEGGLYANKEVRFPQVRALCAYASCRDCGKPGVQRWFAFAPLQEVNKMWFVYLKIAVKKSSKRRID